MAELKESILSDPARALDEEDEATLAAIDRGSSAAAERRTMPMEEARQRFLVEILHLWHRARQDPPL